MIKLNYRKTMFILGLSMFLTIALLGASFFSLESKKNDEVISRIVKAQVDEISFVLSDSLEENDISSCISYLDRQVIANEALDSLTLMRDGKFLFSTDRGSLHEDLVKDSDLQDIPGRHIYSKGFDVVSGGKNHGYILIVRMNSKLYRNYRTQLITDTILFGIGATLLLMILQFAVIYYFYIYSFKRFYHAVLDKDFDGRYHVHEVETLNRIFRHIYTALDTTNENLKKNVWELTYQKNLFKTLFDSLPAPAFFKDTEGRYKRVNKKFLSMHGINSEDEIIGKTVADIFTTEQSAEFAENDAEVFAHPEKQAIMETIVHLPRMGRDYNIVFYKAAIADDDGNVSGLISIMLDVTDERAMEKLKNSYAEQLEKERHRLSEMFKTHSAIMFLVEPETGLIKDANEAAVAFYGYSYDELISMSMSRINLMSQDRLLRVLHSAKVGEITYFEYRHRCKDGTMKDVEIHSSAVNANDETFLYVVIHDITQKKRHELISKLQLDISSAFLLEGEQAIFQEANRVIMRGFGAEFGYFGYIDQDGSLISPAMTVEIFDKCNVPDKTMVAHVNSWAGIWGDSLKEQRVIIKNSDLNTPEGHVALRNAIAVPILHNNELLGQFALANVDGGFNDGHKEIAENIAWLISSVLMHWRKNKYHEENLQKEKHDLELAVEKEMELKKHGEQLLFEQKKFADMGQMINAIAHQWRQPLNALALLIQDLPESGELNEITPEYIEDYVQNGVKLINHMSETIDHFRDFFLPDKDRERFDAITEIIKLFKLINIQLRSKNIDVKITCKCSMKEMSCSGIEDFPGCQHPETRIFGYVGEFKQSILNLIYNSVDAVKAYEELHKGFRGKIGLHLASADDILKIIVEDNGGGISPKIVDKIFDPYFTTKPQGKGTGIGLYMTRLIIEQHMDGRILVDNVEDGARFTISLPVCRD